ncbi:MAG: hypothetical protein ACXVZX_15035 [Terriglobales bacterium]
MRNICLSLLVVAVCLTCVVSMSAATNVLTNPQVSSAGFATLPSLRNLIQNQPQDQMPFF